MKLSDRKGKRGQARLPNHELIYLDLDIRKIPSTKVSTDLFTSLSGREGGHAPALQVKVSSIEYTCGIRASL